MIFVIILISVLIGYLAHAFVSSKYFSGVIAFRNGEDGRIKMVMELDEELDAIMRQKYVFFRISDETNIRESK